MYALFSINITNANVTFESLKCIDCINPNCYYYKSNSRKKKSLCIISSGPGWSSTGLLNHHLLILSKIFAIAEDLLPIHVLNQMNELTACSNYRDPSHEPLTPETDNNLETTRAISNSNEESESSIIEFQAPYTSPAISITEAQTLLRNYRIQFYDGRLPFSVYVLLKERYEKIVS